jgi:siderophore synthetase component
VRRSGDLVAQARTATVLLRLTPDELAALDAAVARSGMARAEWIRRYLRQVVKRVGELEGAGGA